jgi:hypothetical protein
MPRLSLLLFVAPKHAADAIDIGKSFIDESSAIGPVVSNNATFLAHTGWLSL